VLIINADDWGRSIRETDVSLECYQLGRITSVTAMVFMADSERAAGIARDRRIPSGIHLNFTEPFSGSSIPAKLAEHHQRVATYLNANKCNQVFYNPFLTGSFDYVFKSQIEEFDRLFGEAPAHYDGHRHMHVCANMLVACPIPRGQAVRRSFSFVPGEKGFVNRTYRHLVNKRLASHYRLTDYFFALSQQIDAGRFDRVCQLALASKVELMTHAYSRDEERFLKSDEYEKSLQGVRRGTYLEL
jgi:predicted glycoside hydrolase/deacetylase ChbG (UPF0249 family)